MWVISDRCHKANLILMKYDNDRRNYSFSYPCSCYTLCEVYENFSAILKAVQW